MAIITASPSNFQKLLDLQKLSLENIQTVRSLMESNSDNNTEFQTLALNLWTKMSYSLDDLTSIVSSSNTKRVSRTSPLPPVTDEAEDETNRKIDDQTRLLKIIADNTGGGGKKPEVVKPENTEGLGGMLGGIIASITGAALFLQGYLQGFFKLLNVITKPLMMAVETLKEIVTSSEWFGKTMTAVREMFSVVVKPFMTVFETIKSIIAGSETIQKVFTVVGEFFSAIAKPFNALFEVVKSVITGSETFTKVFSGAGSFLEGITTLFPKLTTFFKAIPIIGNVVMIIEAAWKTLSGAFDGMMKGWKEGGFIGAVLGTFEGAFKGLLGNFVGGFFDTVKSVISWVAGAFGFDKVEEFLDSFSFKEIIEKFIEAVFHPIDMLKNLFSGLMSWFEGFKIPGFEIYNPIGENWKVGPWQPFKKETQQAPAEKPAANNTAPAATPNAVEPPKANVDTNVERVEQPSWLEDLTTEVEGVLKIQTADQLNGISKTRTDEQAMVIGRQSAENRDSERQLVNGSVGSTSIVNAPTNISRSTTNMEYRMPIRNPESSVLRYIDSRYSTT